VDAGPCLERRSLRRGACQAVGRVHWAQALRAAAAVLATGAVAVPAGAATYYVSPAGSDDAAGTIAAPFRTLDRLQRVALRPGDVVLLQSGATFTGSLQLDRAGTPAAPISVTSSGPARAIVDGRLAGRTLSTSRPPTSGCRTSTSVARRTRPGAPPTRPRSTSGARRT